MNSARSINTIKAVHPETSIVENALFTGSKGSGANYSYENSLLLSLDNIGGGYRYCAAEKNEGIVSY